MSETNPEILPNAVNTEGGSAIIGDANISGGDFIGRDQTIHGDMGDKTIVGDISASIDVAIGAGAQTIVNLIDKNITQQAPSLVDEADKARANALRILSENVRDYAQRLIQPATQRNKEQRRDPYRGLVAYTLSDAGLFFGRKHAISDLLTRIRTTRLTILQAESGAGKSSLLQAGIAPQLLLSGHLPIILRPYELSPSVIVKQTFLTGLENYAEFQMAPLRSFLHAVTRILGHSPTVYVILDQFEEFFTLLKGTKDLTVAEIRSKFIHELADCLEDQSLNVSWVLAVRSEFFGEFANFRPRISNPFANDYRLNRLTKTEAEEVVIMPATQSQIGIEQALVTAILTDLQQSDGQFAPPQIQLVCQALYQAFKDAQDQGGDPSNTITLALYETEERAQGILGRYLHRTLIRAFHIQAEQQLGRRLLIELISSDSHRLRLTHNELMQRLVPTLSALENLDLVLKTLVDTHLVITAQADDDAEATYELAHDYLLGEIQLDPATQAQKAAQELLRQEVEAYQRFKTLLSKEKFAIINSQRPLLVLDEQTEALLKLSEDKIHQEEREKEKARQRELIHAQALAIEQTGRASTFRWAAIITGFLLLIALIVSYIAYDRQRAAVAAQAAAETAARFAQSRALAVASQAAVTTNRMRAWLLAIEAGRVADTEQAFAAVNQQDQAVGKPLLAFIHEGDVHGAAWNRDESRILSWSGGVGHNTGDIRLWNAASGTLIHTFEHEGVVYGAVWSDDESRILSWSGDNTVRLWDAASGALIHTFEHEGSVDGAQWNRDESRILSWSDDNTVRLWDVASGDLLHTFTHESDVHRAQWSRDESRILSWSGDIGNNTGDVRLWNTASGNLIHTFENKGGINGVAWNGDESRILSWNGDSVWLWDVASGVMLHTFFTPGGGANGAVWNRDESRILSWSGGSVHLWDVASGRLLHTLTHEDGVNENYADGAVWNRDESRILSWSGSLGRNTGDVRLWDAASGALIHTFQHEGSVDGAVWNRDESHILSWSGGSVHLWDVASGALLHTFENEGDVHGAAWNRDESRILSWGYDKIIRMWDATSDDLLHTFEHKGSVWGAAWNRDERRILSWGGGAARLWDVASGRLLHTFQHEGSINGPAWNRDESRILSWSGSLGRNTGDVRLWDAASGRLLHTFTHEGSVDGAAWNRDERRILSWGGGAVRLWDVASGRLLHTFQQEGDINGAAWNRDERRILSWGSGSVHLWDVASGRLLHAFTHEGMIGGIQWNGDESRILSWSSNEFSATSDVRLWDAESGALLQTFTHEGYFDEAAWNRDESRILFWSADDGTTRLWNSQTRLTLFTVLTNSTGVSSAHWNDDESQIMLTTYGGKIYRYYTRMPDLLAAACTRATRNLTWFEWQQYLPGEPYRQTCPNLPVHSSVP